MAEAAADFRYRAFISYSHRDHGWGVWLHRAMEAYRIPRNLAGAEGARRLGRCFRDEAEMGAAAELGPKIAAALGASDVLVAVCSPHSASSPWVNEEIAKFKALGREGRVLALVVDGTPHGAEDECFPAALKVKADGSPAEPLAVDVRKFGRGDAIVRIVSEILGVDYDALRHREARRRRWAAIRAQALFATGLVLTAGALAGGYLAAQNYAASSAARSALLAREANALFAEGRHAEAMLMALEGDPAADANAVTRWFDPEGYQSTRNALARAAVSNRLVSQVMLPGGLVHAAAFLPDGQRYFTVGSGPVVRLWKRGEATPLAEFKPESEEISGFSMFPDGKRFLTIGLEGEVWLWDTDDPKSGRIITTVENLMTIAAHPDGRHFVAGSLVQPTLVYEIDEAGQSAAPVAAFREGEKDEAGANVLAISADGKYLLSADNTVRLWQFGEQAPLKTYALSGVRSLARHPTDGAFVAGSPDGVIERWMEYDAAPTDVRTLGPGAINDLAWLPDGQRFVATRDTGDVAVWDIDPLAPPLILAGADKTTRALSVSPDGKLAVTGSLDGGIRLWNLVDDEAGAAPPGNLTPGFRLPDPTGRHVIAGWPYGGGGLRDAKAGAVAPEFAQDLQGVRAAAFTRDGERFITMTDNDEAKLWQAGKAEALETFTVPNTEMTAIALDQSETQVLTGHSDGAVRLWKIGQRDPVKSIKMDDGDIRALTWLGDGEHFFVGGGANGISLWSVKTGRVRKLADTVDSALDGIVVSPDEKWFVTLFQGYAEPELWPMDGGAPTKMGVPDDAYASAVFLPDGRHLAMLSSRGVGTVWALGDATPMARFGRRGLGQGGMAVLPDGKGLSLSFADERLRTWHLPAILQAGASEQISAACKTLKAIGMLDFTEADWARFPILDRKAPHPCAKVWGFDPRVKAATPK